MKIAMILYYDEDTGELVEAEESLSFMQEDSLLKADVIQDCIGQLQSTYALESNKYFSDIEKIASNEEQMRKDFPSLFNKKGETDGTV